MRKALALIAHTRLECLQQVWASIASQTVGGRPLAATYDVHVFQDGLQAAALAGDRAGHEGVRDMLGHLPAWATVLRQADNLGIALHYDFVERELFVRNAYDFVVFCEDDLVLAPGYMSVVDRMAEKFHDDHRVGMVSAHPGDPTVSIDLQRARRDRYASMGHNWGYGISRSFWQRRQPLIDCYLDLIRDKPYCNRDERLIFEWLERIGFCPFASSQDYVKTCATYALGAVKLSTYPNFGRPIGRTGVHSTPALFEKMGFDRTVIFDGELDSIGDLRDVTYRDLWRQMSDQVGARSVQVIADPDGHNVETWESRLKDGDFHPSRIIPDLLARARASRSSTAPREGRLDAARQVRVAAGGATDGGSAAGAAAARDVMPNPNRVIARNAPCPCRSGLRYKDCHGRLQSAAGATEISTRLGAAQAGLAAGDVEAAEARCREVLERIADHPEALRILARCEYERGHPGESLSLALRAARSMQSRALPPDRAFMVWTDVNFMFTQALSGLDGEFATRNRIAYASRLHSNEAGTGDPRVGVVIVARNDAGAAAASVASVSRQTWRDVELVIAMAGIDPREDYAFAAAARECPFPIRWLSLPGASDATLADAGVRAAGGSYVNVLLAGHEFAQTRLETMVRETAAQGSDWGFSGVAFCDAAGHPVGPEQDERVGAWAERLTAIPEAETIGYTLIHQVFVAVAVGNLFFSRSLYDRAGGFRDLPHTWAWDFCLRALWIAEPVHVPSAQYRHRVAEPGARGEIRSSDREAAHVALFAEYYARACRDECVPPNPFAPSVAQWRMRFLKTVFHAGHVLALPLVELERLGKTVLERRAAPRVMTIEPGVDLIGFAYGELGLAESLRALAKACLAGGIPFGVKDVDLQLKTRQADRSIAAHVVDMLRHRCSVFCLNPDHLQPVRNLLVEGSATGRHNVGYWFWEFEHLPREWDYAIAAVDEIWVSTQFIADAARRATEKPVVLIPAPIDVAPSRPYTRGEFGLAEDRFLFLFSFDFNSFTSRKNPEGAIAAFREAFVPARRDVGLVIKSINAGNQPAKMRELRALIGGDDRIVIVDGFFTRDQVSGLQTVVDAYLSLHRAEGLGLGLAESMYQGKPVIGTGYSGNLEFMNEQNSCLVDYRRVPIAKGEYIYHDERFEWAEPDVRHAALHMRRLVDDADFRVRIAARGQQDIRTRFTLAATAAAIRGRLEELGFL